MWWPCDLHPKYNSTAVAEAMGKPVVYVQHHYAHILSCMAENDHSEKVIGVSFDGTGYGTDGTIWGGEILEADYDGFRRLGSIAPFIQIGGDSSAREGWRIASSMMYSLTKDRGKAEKLIKELDLCDERNARAQVTMAEKKINAVTSTSVGRLFDAVSAILGIRKESTFEGEAATTLQFRAEEWKTEVNCDAAGSRLKEDPEKIILSTDELVREIVERRLRGEDPKRLAYYFHAALADQAVAGCVKARELSGTETVALSGGCYQNTLLLQLTQERLEEQGFYVLRHSLIPPNDGGIALGQAVYAMKKINKH